MAVLRIQDFSGVIPVTGDRALPDNYATRSMNSWLYGSELRGLRPPDEIAALTAGNKKVMRIPKRTPGSMVPLLPAGVIPPPNWLGDSQFKQFSDPDTDIVKGQLVNDSFERWYFASPTTGPMFNTYSRLLGTGADYKLGCPGPDVSDTTTNTIIVGTPTGGVSTNLLDIAWVYTWANAFGEESSPCLPVLLADVKSDATVPLSGIDDPLNNASDPRPDGYPQYTKKHVYRSITGASGQTTYYRVSTHVIGGALEPGWISQTQYNDNMASSGGVNPVDNAKLAQRYQLESTRWQPPPNDTGDLKNCIIGFVSMPNGFLVGFTGGNRLLMSEPYHFHAWPAEYEQATEYPIVGLGVFGQTCVVATQGYPTSASGTHPSTMAFSKSTTMEPCLSRGSVVTTPNGVVWASPNGLIMAGPGGMQNVTEKLITREQWTRDYMPSVIRACRYQNGYLALRDWPGVSNNTMFFVDPTALKVALTEVTDTYNKDNYPGSLHFDVANIFNDIWSGNVFLFGNDGKLSLWDPVRLDSETPALVTNTQLMPVVWRSKEFQYNHEANFGAYAIYWDDARYSNVNWGTGIMPTTEKVRLRVYVNRVLRYDQVVPRNGRQVRLPSGFKGDIWQFEILARAPVYSIHVASTARELKAA